MYRKKLFIEEPLFTRILIMVTKKTCFITFLQEVLLLFSARDFIMGNKYVSNLLLITMFSVACVLREYSNFWRNAFLIIGYFGENFDLT